MAFSTPQFNLTCDIYTGPWLTKTLRISGQACNLQGGRRSRVFSSGLVTPNNQVSNWGPTYLLLPPGTDVRHELLTGVDDVVECPAGSGRWYYVLFVEDVGKGFPNEFRMAEMAQISSHLDAVQFAGLFWPVPMP